MNRPRTLAIAFGSVGMLALATSLAAAHDDSASSAADVDMQRVLKQHAQLGAKPLSELTPQQARQQPSPADAVKAVLNAGDATAPPPQVSKRDRTYETAGGTQLIRLYTPRNAQDNAPVIVYYHGGGWVIADIDTYEASAIALADKTDAIVASVGYRQGPEHRFPAAHDDAFAAYQWVLKHARDFGGDANNVAVAGESAGGNLAANVAIKARDTGVPMPVHMLLVYPVASAAMDTESYREHGDAKPLSKAGMQWFVEHALNPGDAQDPRIDLVNADLRSLPPATVITAEIDPLRSEGKLLADRLEAAGNRVDYRNFDGVTHEFFGMAAVVSDAGIAQDHAAKQLKAGFGDAEVTAASDPDGDED